MNTFLPRRVGRRAVVAVAAIVLLSASVAPAAASARAAPGAAAKGVTAAAGFALEDLGGSWPEQKPAVVTGQWGRIDAFMVGWNGQLYHYRLVQGQATYLESLGGSFAYRSMAAISPSPDRRDVFAIDTADRLWHYWQGPGDTAFHQDLIGGYWPAPGLLEAVSWGGGRWDVFLTGPSAGMGHYWYPVDGAPGLPFAFEQLSGFSTTTGRGMSATAWPGRLDVMFLDRGDRLVHLWQNPGEGFYYELMPMPAYVDNGSVDSVSSVSGRVDVFMSGWNGNQVLYVNHFWQDPGRGGWGREVVHQVGSGPGVKPITASTWGWPRTDYFLIRWTDASLLHGSQEGGPFVSEAMGGYWNFQPSAVSWGPRRLDVFLIGNDRRLYHYWQG